MTRLCFFDQLLREKMFSSFIFCAFFYTALCQNYELIWEDNFDTLDKTKWEQEVTAWGGGNGEFQVYTPNEENTYIKDGKLYIQPTLLINSTNPLTGDKFGEDFMVNGVLDLEEMYGRCTQEQNNGCRREGSAGNMSPTMSGRLRTTQLFSIKFGKVDIWAKMPVGDWMWPAMWMLPEEFKFGEWPRSGEIDITESIGNRDCVNNDGDFIGIQRMGSALHWGPDDFQNRFWLTREHKFNISQNFGDNFHKYTLEWSVNGFKSFVDDKSVMTVPDPQINENPEWAGFWDAGRPWFPDSENPWVNATNMAPFDEPFHFLLNVAVGGIMGYIPDNVVNHGGRYEKPWNNNMDQTEAMRNFYEKRSDWLWSWTDEGENAAMQVDKIQVWQEV